MDRRYRKKMQRHWAAADAKARRAVDRLDPHGWFDLWHTHVDWYGRGNARGENRRSVALIAIQLLGYLQRHFGNRTDSIQTWAMICSDTMDTAVYAHSVNPNGSAFPVELLAAWLPGVPSELDGLVPSGYEVGVVAGGADTSAYVVRLRVQAPSGHRVP